MTLSSGIGTSSCTSPYDGTFSGTVEGQGKDIYPSGSTVPYLLDYTLEVTFECADENTAPGNQQSFDLYVTHAKVSNPYFDCTSGCTPPDYARGDADATILAPGDRDTGRVSLLEIFFPDGKSLEVAPLFGGYDAKTIEADQTDQAGLLSASILGLDPHCQTSSACHLETSLCHNCDNYQQEGFSMLLNKIS